MIRVKRVAPLSADAPEHFEPVDVRGAEVHEHQPRQLVGVVEQVVERFLAVARDLEAGRDGR